MTECQCCGRRVNTLKEKYGTLTWNFGLLGGAGRVLCKRCTLRCVHLMKLSYKWPFKKVDAKNVEGKKVVECRA